MTLSLSTEVFACYIYLCVPSNIFHQLHHHSSMSTSKTKDLNVAASQTTVVKAAYWVSSSSQEVSDINSTLFTHLFCAFAALNPTTYQVTISSPTFSTFTQTVQKINPEVKTLLSIGGDDRETIRTTFADMASQASRRKCFIDSSIQLARDNSFHGLDLDWEYPKTNAEMINFGSLINEWRKSVVDEANASKRTALLLTATVFRNADYCTISYPISAVSASLDWINVKSYDYYGPAFDVGKTQTYPPAALYPGGSTSLVNGIAGIISWLNELPANKIVIGLPFYGYAWKLTSSIDIGLYNPADGPAFGPTGDQWYNEICTHKGPGYTTVYNEDVISNYCYSGTDLVWIGYDDTKSICAKVSYAKEKGLLGYFAWHTGADTQMSTLSKQASDKWDEP